MKGKDNGTQTTSTNEKLNNSISPQEKKEQLELINKKLINSHYISRNREEDSRNKKNNKSKDKIKQNKEKNHLDENKVFKNNSNSKIIYNKTDNKINSIGTQKLTTRTSQNSFVVGQGTIEGVYDEKVMDVDGRVGDESADITYSAKPDINNMELSSQTNISGFNTVGQTSRIISQGSIMGVGGGVGDEAVDVTYSTKQIIILNLQLEHLLQLLQQLMLHKI